MFSLASTSLLLFCAHAFFHQLFDAVSSLALHEDCIPLQQERVPDSPPLGRKQHEGNAHHKSNHQRNRVGDLPRQLHAIAPHHVAVRRCEGKECKQRERRVEEVRPREAIRRGILRAFASRVERPDAAERRDAVVQPPRRERRSEAVGEREEDTGGGARGDEGGHEPPVEAAAVAAAVGEKRGEDGEREDGGGGEEDVEASGAVEDQVEDV